MPFRDLSEFLTDTPKCLPIHGKLWEFPTRISAESGIVLLRIANTTQTASDGGEDGDALVAQVADAAQLQALQTELLGCDPEDLIRQGWTMEEVAHVFKTLMAWHLYGQESAETAWEQVGPTPAPNRASRRAASAAPVTSNPGRGSRAGSKTTASGKAPRKAAPAGRTSSNGGR
jgi:hypothetical protein